MQDFAQLQAYLVSYQEVSTCRCTLLTSGLSRVWVLPWGISLRIGDTSSSLHPQLRIGDVLRYCATCVKLYTQKRRMFAVTTLWRPNYCTTLLNGSQKPFLYCVKRYTNHLKIWKVLFAKVAKGSWSRADRGVERIQVQWFWITSLIEWVVRIVCSTQRAKGRWYIWRYSQVKLPSSAV